jgi:predicted CXXCH cytochrome family protein
MGFAVSLFVAALTFGLGAQGPRTERGYVGAKACNACHAPIYARWSKTRMANVVRDPRLHPDAIIPDLSKADPLVTFTKSDIAFVYGSKWKQRYFTRIGDDYFPLGAQWDITHGQWRRYFVADGTDWWVKFYPADNLKRPTGPTCDGCHSVGYDIATKTVSEWNVGCERCHGPGSEHAAQPTRANIFNPARVDPVHGTDTCIQCHSQGQPLTNPIDGRYYDWPIGFRVGLNLSEFWRLERSDLGKTDFLYFADGTAHKNRMQGNDFVASRMYQRGVTCFTCHDVHGTDNNADLRQPVNTLCLQCHGPKSANGPHTATLEQHTHHRNGSAGSECVGCHMPKIEQTLGDVMVRAHTFRFIAPAMTETLKVPNPCTTCHADKSTGWAIDTLKTWPEFSAWRVGP